MFESAQREEFPLLAVVADGAGSDGASDVASTILCNAFVRAFVGAHQARQISVRPTVPDEVADELLRSAYWKSVHALAFAWAQLSADAEGRVPRATVSALWLRPDGVSLAAVGDGFIVVRRTDGELTQVHEPNRGVYANETLFAGMVEPAVIHARDVDAVLMGTDGFGDAFADEAGLIRSCSTILESISAGEITSETFVRFLGSRRIVARTDDDVSMVCARFVDAG